VTTLRYVQGISLCRTPPKKGLSATRHSER
jgi:hypothetical protein